MRVPARNRNHLWRYIVALALTAVLLLAVTGCSALSPARDESTTSSLGAPSLVAPSPEQNAVGGSGVSGEFSAGVTDKSGTADRSGSTPAEQLLVRTATMRLRVDDIDKTIARIRSTTAEFKGQIDDLQVSTENDTPIYRPVDVASVSGETVPLSAYITLRVPSDRLAEFSKRISSYGKVLRESANQSDVTQQHIDLTARLKNLRAEEVRLRQFLDAAKNVKEMLLVEQELSRVRSEIESMQSQLDYLNKQISYGTLTVELQKPADIVRPTGTDWGFGQAITDGIRGAASALRSLITVLIALSPLIVLVLIVALVIRWILRRRRERLRSSRNRERVHSKLRHDADQEASGGVSRVSAMHPRIRLPLWVAFTLPAAAYVYRSVTRGFDFTLDVPMDLIALAVFIAGIGAVGWSRHAATKEGHEHSAEEESGEDRGTRYQGQDDEVVRDVEGPASGSPTASDDGEPAAGGHSDSDA